MTNPPDQSNPGDQPDAESEEVQSLGDDATLQDAEGQDLSKGKATIFQNNVAKFYPHDSASLDMLRKRVKTLFLAKSRQSLGVQGIRSCPAPVSGDLVHFHVKLSE